LLLAQQNDDAECLGDQVLVKRYSDESLHCMDALTATIWDTYGTGKIIDAAATSSEDLSSEHNLSSNVPLSQSKTTPNIIVIMPDDVGWYNIGAYNDGIIAVLTPNIDSIGRDGMRFTDYYADPSCTAGRSSFITGELPIRTGFTTVGTSRC